MAKNYEAVWTKYIDCVQISNNDGTESHPGYVNGIRYNIHINIRAKYKNTMYIVE